jgi:predicted dehydrogenase
MKMNLGIIGAENSHAAAIAEALNIRKVVKGFAVTHIWGERPELAAATARQGRIANIVDNPIDMLGKIDCLMVDHRDGKYHVAAARPFARAGLPIFIDKPLSTSLASAKSFLKFCAAHHAPVITCSAVPHQQAVKEVKREMAKLGRLKAIYTAGPGDYKSPYSGIWFYGQHQADLVVELIGPNPTSASMTANGTDSTAVLNYPDNLTVSMNFIAADVKTFCVTVVGSKGVIHKAIAYDADPYMTTNKLFTSMFKTGKMPFSHQRMLAPIAILEAMDRSLSANRPAKVTKV